MQVNFVLVAVPSFRSYRILYACNCQRHENRWLSRDIYLLFAVTFWWQIHQYRPCTSICSRCFPPRLQFSNKFIIKKITISNVKRTLSAVQKCFIFYLKFLLYRKFLFAQTFIHNQVFVTMFFQKIWNSNLLK